MTVEKAGGALEGVQSITADPESKKIEVSYDESMISLEEIQQAIDRRRLPRRSNLVSGFSRADTADDHARKGSLPSLVVSMPSRS